MPDLAAATPLVLEVCSAHDVLRFAMQHPAGSNHLVVCSDRSAFLRHLLSELPPPDHEDGQNDNSRPRLDLLRPTLDNLKASRSVDLAFCPDLATLQAHLSMLLHKPPPETRIEVPKDSDPSRPLLAIIDPIRIHEPTSAFSAQGFNRTFAAAVDAAHHLHRQLVMVECARPTATEDRVDDEVETRRAHPGDDPWDQRLSMLSVTTKTFGAGERGWVGRTVRIRQVAERWCKFVKLDDGTREMQQ